MQAAEDLMSYLVVVYGQMWLHLEGFHCCERPLVGSNTTDKPQQLGLGQAFRECV